VHPGFFADLRQQPYAWLALVMALHAFFWHAVLPQFEVITLAHLREQTSRYSQIRLWGSIGFILTVVAWAPVRMAEPGYLPGGARGHHGRDHRRASLWVPNAQPASQANAWPGRLSSSNCAAPASGVYAVALMQ
jgi:PPP family 3-phenylpropionic acid transporter